MNSFPRCIQVRFDHNTMWMELADGRILSVDLDSFPRLRSASPAQRRNYTISGGGSDLQWNDLDEDISVSGILRDKTHGVVSASQRHPT